MVSPHVSRYQTFLAICFMNSHLSIHQWSVLSHPAACHRSEEVAKGVRKQPFYLQPSPEDS